MEPKTITFDIELDQAIEVSAALDHAELMGACGEKAKDFMQQLGKAILMINYGQADQAK